MHAANCRSENETWTKQTVKCIFSYLQHNESVQSPKKIMQTLAVTYWTFLMAQTVKNPPAKKMDLISGSGTIPMEKEMATHPSILAWRIPWTEESMGSQGEGYDWAIDTFTFNMFGVGETWQVYRSLPKYSSLPVPLRQSAPCGGH